MTVEANWFCRYVSKPVSSTWFTFSMSGPNEDCSRKRTAAAELSGVPAVVTVTFSPLEVPPPGAGFVTFTVTVPSCVFSALPIAVIIVGVT